MDIKTVNVCAVLMPNGEIICMGKTIGFIGENEGQIPAKYVQDYIGNREVKLIVQGGVPHLQECPADVEVLILDEDDGDEDYHPMDRSI